MLLKSQCDLLNDNPIMAFLYQAIWEITNPRREKTYASVIATLERDGYVAQHNGKLLGKCIKGIELTPKGLEYLNVLSFE